MICYEMTIERYHLIGFKFCWSLKMVYVTCILNVHPMVMLYVKDLNSIYSKII